MFFWNSLAFSMIQWMLAIWSLVPLLFLKPAWTPNGLITHLFFYCWIALHCMLYRCLSIYLLKDISWLLPSYGIMKKDMISSVYKFLYRCNFSIPLDKYLVEWLLDHTVRVCFILYETAKLSSMVTLPAVSESSCCSTSLPAFGGVGVFNFSCSNRCVCVAGLAGEGGYSSSALNVV